MICIVKQLTAAEKQITEILLYLFLLYIFLCRKDNPTKMKRVSSIEKSQFSVYDINFIQLYCCCDFFLTIIKPNNQYFNQPVIEKV